MGRLSFLAGVYVHIVNEGRIQVVGIPVDTDQLTTRSGVRIDQDGGPEQFAPMLP